MRLWVAHHRLRLAFPAAAERFNLNDPATACHAGATHNAEWGELRARAHCRWVGHVCCHHFGSMVVAS